MSFLQLPTEEQAASAESIPGLCTSGQAWQSVRQGAGGGRGELAMGKGQPACPEADSVQLSESLTSTQSAPTLSLTPPASHRAPTQASGGAQGWKGTTTPSVLRGERDSIARRATVLSFL